MKDTFKDHTLKDHKDYKIPSAYVHTGSTIPESMGQGRESLDYALNSDRVTGFSHLENGKQHLLSFQMPSTYGHW